MDSAASLPQEINTEQQLQIVPMEVTIEGRTYMDGVDLSSREFFQRLRKLKKCPTTSSPNPNRFCEAYQAASQNSSSILCITTSTIFSGSFNSATIAAKMFQEQNRDVGISILDSRTAAGSEGLITTQALRKAQSGANLKQVLESAKRIANDVSLIGILDTLYYAWKSGRVPGISHLYTSLFSIKPIFELRNGEIKALSRPRTRKQAIDRLIDLTYERVRNLPMHAVIMHGDSFDDARRIRDVLSENFNYKELYISEFSAVMGSHTGPNLLGISAWTEAE